jgi:type IV pilus assembly PilX-like protein
MAAGERRLYRSHSVDAGDGVGVAGDAAIMKPLTAGKRFTRERLRSERGVALFLTLILVSTLSVLTVSLMFLSQSESFASGNYRLMTQARYGAEAGVQKAADYILSTDLTGPAALLAPSVQSPVQYGALGDVVLSSDPSHTSNFPDPAIIAAFQAATNGTLVAGNSTINFTAYATLLSVDKIKDAYTDVEKVVQTWQITSNATIVGIRKSTVEVSALLDSDKVPTIPYAAFGTDPGCGSLSFQGNVSTNSYNPFGLTGSTSPTMFDTGGDVGTNGNLTIQGSVDVKGNLSSPITGVGGCTNNGQGVASVAATGIGGNATIEGGAPLQLPQTVQMPTPPIPPYSGTPGPIGISSPNGSTCGALGLTAANCSVSGDVITLTNTTSTPLAIPYVQLSGQAKIVLTASSSSTVANAYNFDAISVGSSNNSIKIDTPSKDFDVKINISGLGPTGAITDPVLNISGGAKVGGYNTCAANNCSQYDSSLLQVIYGGTGTVYLEGNPDAAAVYYMPNANVTFSGTSSLYGAIIAHDLAINGAGNGISINYDQSLAGKGHTASPPMLASFSWKKY